MEKLERKEGVYYTQNAEDIAIEERVFFREGIGMAMNENYRVATDEELAAWEVYKKRMQRESEPV